MASSEESTNAIRHSLHFDSAFFHVDSFQTMVILVTSYGYLLIKALALVILKEKAPKVLEKHDDEGLVVISTLRTRGVMSLM